MHTGILQACVSEASGCQSSAMVYVTSLVTKIKVLKFENYLVKKQTGLWSVSNTLPF